MTVTAIDKMDDLVIERDGGFCSGGDEDEGFYSHTDASDDSGDIKVRTNASLLRNKRKCSEPRRLDTELPAKKRKLDIGDLKTSPFRPWGGSPSPPTPLARLPPTPSPSPRPLLQDKSPQPVQVPPLLLASPLIHPLHSRLLVQQDEPLSLVSKKKLEPRSHPQVPKKVQIERTLSESVSKTIKPDRTLRLQDCSRSFPSQLQQQSCVPQQSSLQQPSSSQQSSLSGSSQQQCSMQQRNYKNMTRERRIEANARERTRVHTISAAFDTLRHSIPAYSHNQKLSKLSVLRIACSYIMTLSRLAGEDYSADSNQPSISDCVSSVTRTIQTEGKIRKKRDE